MKRIIGVRKEDKNIWERRVPIIPEHVKKLKEEFGIQTVVEPFERRAFSHEEYVEAGAEINSDLSKCPVIFAVKEIPAKLLMADKTYIYFSHTIKGQDYNMGMLKRLMDLKCTLIDYEIITDEKGRRLVFFGKYAGLAGMVDALYGFGQRLKSLGYKTPFLKVKQAYQYKDISDAKEEIKKVGEEIKEKGLPDNFAPYIFGFAGYGNVSKGAQEIFDLLPFEEITPGYLNSTLFPKTNLLYKTVFQEKDLAEPININNLFDLQDYYQHPEKYKSKFENYLKKIDVLINCIYWTEKYPRLVTKEFLQKEEYKLKVICDISCDINGSVEITYKATKPDNPAFIYNPQNDNYTDGFEGEGIVNITVDNLPAELPVDSSVEFSNSLFSFVNGIVEADLSKPFDEAGYPPEIKRAVILYKGKLTPKYEYIKEFM
ncbi:MAG: bifunctional lysine ketoglutarate reductase /saccharopine dehydrogenase family protein [Ignavibacteria bacterium]|jgi:alpha-aminoadipic semialdehyde synthase